METDNGGWTLFFNYKHTPGMNFALKDTMLPETLKVNSHMYLQGAGFNARDVHEIRFMCTEASNVSANKIWHFKTNNNDIIQVAFNGDQTKLKVSLVVKQLVSCTIHRLLSITKT